MCVYAKGALVRVSMLYRCLLWVIPRRFWMPSQKSLYSKNHRCLSIFILGTHKKKHVIRNSLQQFMCSKNINYVYTNNNTNQWIKSKIAFKLIQEWFNHKTYFVYMNWIVCTNQMLTFFSVWDDFSKFKNSEKKK